MLVDKNSRINSKIKCPQMRQCKSTGEEHAGSGKIFENITLCLDQLPLKIQFIKERRTLKTLVLSREANTPPQCKSSYKEQAGSDKNLSVKPYFKKKKKTQFIEQTRALIALSN